MRRLEEPFGPAYPQLGSSVAKHRKRKSPSKAEREAHGEAVHRAVQALQRQDLRRAGYFVTDGTPNCASGTWHSSGDDIHRAVRRQQENLSIIYADRVRRTRTEGEWADLYEQAMAEKRRRHLP
jgi:hypothetical protein